MLRLSYNCPVNPLEHGIQTLVLPRLRKALEPAATGEELLHEGLLTALLDFDESVELFQRIIPGAQDVGDLALFGKGWLRDRIFFESFKRQSSCSVPCGCHKASNPRVFCTQKVSDESWVHRRVIGHKRLNVLVKRSSTAEDTNRHLFHEGHAAYQHENRVWLTNSRSFANGLFAHVLNRVVKIKAL
nr:hypothetical protein [Prosthecobacter debontii]